MKHNETTHYPSPIQALLLIVAVPLYILATTTAAWGQTHTLQGRVMLGDTIPAAYATIFVPTTGQGCISDEAGFYTLQDLAPGSVEVEYAHLGYRTERHQLTLTQPVTHHDELLEEQPLMLSAVFATPNGEDPALYILRHVAQAAKANRERLTSFDADLDYWVDMADFDIIGMILPSSALKTIKFFLRAFRIAALFEYAVTKPKLNAHYGMHQTVRKMKTKHTKKQMYSCPSDMKEKAQEQLMRISEAKLFDDYYGEYIDKYLKPKKKKASDPAYRLEGCFEEDGRNIDVLVYERRDTAQKVTDIYKLYVVEDLWGILREEKYNVRKDKLEMRVEYRDIGQGIYMPITEVNEPFPMSFDEKIKDLQPQIDSLSHTGKKADSRLVERLMTIKEGERKFNITFKARITMRYDNVKFK